MVQRVTTKLLDDLDGTPAERTFQFGFDGVNYEIDLSTDNIQTFHGVVDEFVEKARKVTVARRVVKSAGLNPDHSRAVRAWARQNGHQVSDRGRLSAELIAAFDAAPGH